MPYFPYPDFGGPQEDNDFNNFYSVCRGTHSFMPNLLLYKHKFIFLDVFAIAECGNYTVRPTTKLIYLLTNLEFSDGTCLSFNSGFDGIELNGRGFIITAEDPNNATGILCMFIFIYIHRNTYSFTYIYI